MRLVFLCSSRVFSELTRQMQSRFSFFCAHFGNVTSRFFIRRFLLSLYYAFIIHGITLPRMLIFFAFVILTINHSLLFATSLFESIFIILQLISYGLKFLLRAAIGLIPSRTSNPQFIYNKYLSSTTCSVVLDT